jgi:cyclopropane-fatty-acyl-phospholipid synthase
MDEATVRSGHRAPRTGLSLGSWAGRRVRPALLRGLSSWAVGRLTVHLPDGSVHVFGAPEAEPHATLFVENEAFLGKFALRGDMGVGESYVDGDWRSDDLTRFLSLALLNREHLPLDTPLSLALNFGKDMAHRLSPNTRAGSRRNIRRHYDLGNEMFALFLDETMTYSSALFEHAEQPLAAAQRHKFQVLGDRLRLGPRDHLLEIGCGWGGFAIFAASTYGCRVTGITVSEQQHRLARERVREAGLDRRIEVRLQDYRDVDGRFDKIASIEMFEALGEANWPTFFGKCEALLGPDGLMALQTIAMPDHRFAEYRKHTDWLQRYIFPGSLLASVSGLSAALARSSRLGIHHLEDIGIHYAPTLARWKEAFFRNLGQVRALGYDDRFIRTWDYYLSVCEAAFATRTLGNLQVLLTRPGNRRLAAIPGL